MNKEVVLMRLMNHANLPVRDSSADQDDSLVYVLYQSGRSNITPDCQRHIGDILNCIVSLVGIGESDVESRYILRICYSIAAIQNRALQLIQDWRDKKLFKENILHDLENSIIKIGIAWEMVCSGEDTDAIKILIGEA